MRTSGSSVCNTNTEERMLSQRAHSEASVDEGTASAHTVTDCREIIWQNMKNRLRTVESYYFGGTIVYWDFVGTLLYFHLVKDKYCCNDTGQRRAGRIISLWESLLPQEQPGK